MPKNAKVDLEVDESDTFSVLAGYFRKSCTEPSSRFLQESLRSYYVGCEAKPEGSLWAYKYKPTKAVEVCGNDEAVNFLSDWLHQWHERRYKPRKKTCQRDTRVMQDDDDYMCSDSDYDSEDMNEEDSLQNVLLITGPIGSGKSAAVYACAQEQGFDILELNASDCRNETVVKQYFGDALGSHGFKRLSEHTLSSQKITTNFPPASALINDKAADEVNDRVVEPIPLSDDEAHSPFKTSQKLLGKNDAVACDKVQTLILVEDVDILFPEDRGCIVAIQQIAETTRGPIILTSNSDNPAYRYRFLEPNSQLLTRPVLDTHSRDHDCGYDGVNIENSMAIINKFPAVVTVQVTKDKQDFSIHLGSSVAAKHGENGSTMAGFDIQDIGKQPTCIVRGETKFKNSKRNKTVAGVFVTFLGENVSTGVKLEDQIALGKRLVLVGSTGTVRSQNDSAYGANVEVRLREADFLVGQNQSSLSLSLVQWRGDLALGANFQSQISLGRSYKMAVLAGLNNKLSGQINVRTSSSDQLQISLIVILPVAKAIYKNFWTGVTENYSIY
ncbi:uncharacterized protein LOC127126517 [Lathyrus oleraceus]|uniref:uncharacterized protein LOC127126517 n=1 Tax=Pisum sativum TaxID=3888 RepID=UPI0021CEEEB2|nr:uncharacterized protein LOC127126517 [Pisum sativum]